MSQVRMSAIPTASAFALCGLIFGTWSASIPSLKLGLGLDTAQLGSILLFFSVGVLPGNLAAVWALRRWGVAVSIWLSIAIAIPAFSIAIAGFSMLFTILGLIAAGFSFSILNVAMNSSASNIELLGGKRIMSTCHGMWSIGAMIGSGLCSVALSAGALPLYWMLAGIGTIAFVTLVYFAKALATIKIPTEISEHTTAKKKKFQWPNAALWGLILLSMCNNLTEGTMADWAAIFMRSEVGVPLWLEGWGFGVYAFCMAATRFVGDKLLNIYTSERILKTGGLLAASGFMLAVWTQQTIPTLIGFGLIGAGVALGAPILYGASARVKGMAPGTGLAIMNTFAMIGFLAGPALIGFIAKLTSLPVAFTIVATTALFWAWQSKRMQQVS
jgi:predicted MFS family arabinose efflux permease